MTKKMLVSPDQYRAAWQIVAKRPIKDALRMLQGRDWHTWLIVLRAWQGR